MDIYEQIVELRRQARRGAVATITNVRGSIPSFQTAKMLVRDDGSIAGTPAFLRRSASLAQISGRYNW
jgi:xanthine dehydrogenase accessory factor